MHEQIRQVLSELPQLRDVAPDIPGDADLWEAGLDSLASVQLLLLLEERFEIELPDEALTLDTFRSVRSLAEAVQAQTDERRSAAL
ncbi:hypothetical protein N566_04800 [Streptomycetaceae bacterium MP113-05]|nr:hypothetical protein N566_04800 [Streptomycetaceae bacterium MP113-05]